VKPTPEFRNTGSPETTGKRWLRAVTVACICHAVLAQSSGLWWPGEVSSHWTLHSAIVLMILAVIWRRHARFASLTIIAFIACAWPWILAAYEPRLPSGGPGSQRVALVHANVLFSNDRRMSEARALSADCQVLSLVEVVPEDTAAFTNDPRWPHQIWHVNGPWTAGVALLSAHPLRSTLTYNLDGCPTIEAVVDIGSSPLRIIVTHTSSPGSPSQLRQRDRQLAGLAALASRSSEPVVLVGDLNITVASPTWRSFRAESGLLRPCALETGTWPSLLGPCGIVIDHVLASPSVSATSRRTPWISGSDHRGLAVELTVQ
jgi:endonuclease/exonuclease/phosphatase (EEP) superfamily protein YafD